MPQQPVSQGGIQIARAHAMLQQNTPGQEANADTRQHSVPPIRLNQQSTGSDLNRPMGGAIPTPQEHFSEQFVQQVCSMPQLLDHDQVLMLQEQQFYQQLYGEFKKMMRDGNLAHDKTMREAEALFQAHKSNQHLNEQYNLMMQQPIQRQDMPIHGTDARPQEQLAQMRQPGMRIGSPRVNLGMASQRLNADLEQGSSMRQAPLFLDPRLGPQHHHTGAMGQFNTVPSDPKAWPSSSRQEDRSVVHEPSDRNKRPKRFKTMDHANPGRGSHPR